MGKGTLNVAATETSPFVLFAGGRSGGHVFPALALGQELLDRGWRVAFVGTQRGLEAELVRSHRFTFFPIAAAPLVGQGLAARLHALWTLARSTISCWRLIRRLGVSVVLGTGGYVSAPAVVGGWLARRLIFLVEPNAVAGVANRWLSRLSHGAAVALAATRTQLACPSWLTGVPVRREFFRVGPPPPSDRLSLLVIGGSQGARQLNELVPKALAGLRDEFLLSVLHQSGAGQKASTEEAYLRATAGRAGGPEVQVTDFLDDVATAMARSHLVLSRAGAITLAEICAVGRAALLFPLRLAGGHQRNNAAALVDAGAALAAPDTGLGPASLTSLLQELLRDPQRLTRMGEAARSLAHPDASAAIVARLEVLLRARSPERQG